jgi:acid phosphatase class B
MINQYKIEIFEGINDNPISANSESGGNGADLIDRFNSVIDELSPIFPVREKLLANANYYIATTDKVLL